MKFAFILFLVIHFSLFSFANEENRYPKIVQIKIIQENDSIAFGTGFFIAPDTVVTNFHVIANFKQFVAKHIFFANARTGEFIPFTEIIALSAKDDLAVLRTDNYKAQSFYPIKQEAPKEESKKNLWVYSPGFLNNHFLVSRGVLNNDTEIRNTNHYGLQRGRSGSPVFLKKDHSMIGVITASSETNHLYFTPISSLRELLSRPFLSSPCVTYGCIEREKINMILQAEQGDNQAQYRLGLMYEQGDSRFPLNVKESFKWYQKASAQRHINAQFELGVLLLTHPDLHYNSTNEAFQWLYKAASKGEINAQFTLGLMYYNGHDDLDQDIKQAMHWWSIASDNNHTGARFHLALAIEKHGDPSKINKAVTLYEQASSEGHHQAALNLGNIYYYGQEDMIPKDIEKALFYWEKAYKQGSLRAPFHLGMFYHTNYDPHNSSKWFYLAKEREYCYKTRSCPTAEIQ